MLARLAPFLPPLAALDRWAARAHQDACDNARAAATLASRRRVERAEVERYLATREAAEHADAVHA